MTVVTSGGGGGGGALCPHEASSNADSNATAEPCNLANRMNIPVVLMAAKPLVGIVSRNDGRGL